MKCGSLCRASASKKSPALSVVCIPSLRLYVEREAAGTKKRLIISAPRAQKQHCGSAVIIRQRGSAASSKEPPASAHTFEAAAAKGRREREAITLSLIDLSARCADDRRPRRERSNNCNAAWALYGYRCVRVFSMRWALPLRARRRRRREGEREKQTSHTVRSSYQLPDRADISISSHTKFLSSWPCTKAHCIISSRSSWH